MEKFIFGITGPTGAGKSTVSDIFRELGVYVADADIVAREVTKKGSECLGEIHNTFGDCVITNNAELDRKALAQIVFQDKTKLRLLNDITHKYIKKQLEDEIEKSHSDIAAIDGAVIIDSPVMDMCKCLVVVTAQRDIRINRIIARDNIDIDMANKRINSQMSDSQYKQYADFIIENNGDNTALKGCVEGIYNKIKDISKATGTQNTTP